MRVLLIGGSGQLGAEIVRRWSDCAVIAPPRVELDLENVQAVSDAIQAHRPDVLINCAAFHNVDRCTIEPERAFAVNALAVGAMARLCALHDVRFVTVSTDYVFDGSAQNPYTEDDAPNPISAYGTSKLAGEYLVEMLQSRALVVRTCGLFGVRVSSSKGYTFVDQIVAKARAGESIRIVNDVIASPTYAGHLAQVMRALLDTDAFGVYHACNVGPVSWYDFAVEALRQADIAHPIEPISAAEWKTDTRRPAYSALANKKLDALGITMPPWQSAITAYLTDKGDRSAKTS